MSDPETRARVSQKRKKKLADKYRRLDTDRNRTPRDVDTSRQSVRSRDISLPSSDEEIDLYPYAGETGYPYDFDFEYWRRKYDLPDEDLD